MLEDIATFLPPHRVWHAGAARPVLALHCSLAHSGAWAGLAGLLPEVSVTAMDQPGHGRAGAWDGRSDLHGEGTRGAIALAEEIGGGAAIDLFGHSFGATICLRIALERPDLVRSLLLVEPVIFAAARAADNPAYAPFRAAHLAFAALVQAGRFEEAAALFHGQWGSGEPFDALPERTRAYMVERIHLIVAQNPVLLEDGAGLLRYMGLESLGVPVLLVEGAQSPPIIGAVHAELARRLPQATRLSVPGAGHMVSITHAGELAPAARTHLAGC